MKISVFRLCRPRKEALPCERLVKKAVACAMRRRQRQEVNVIFCGARDITALNRRFLGKNRITDVIAFSLGGPASGKEPSVGEIYVCVPQGEKQAAEYGNGVAGELLILCVHGALHLSGMEDATAAQRQRMDRAAQRVIASVRVQRGR